MKKKICACDVLVIHDVRNYRERLLIRSRTGIAPLTHICNYSKIINSIAKKIKLKIFTTFIFTISCVFIG